MNIVIVGAGSVGLELVEQLIREGHNITVIDSEQKNVQDAVNRFDVKGLVGNGGSLDTLLEAGVRECDLFIAVTEKDEINVLACMVAKSIGVQYTVARVRNPEYTSMANDKNNIGISLMVNPEYQVSEEILNILQLPSAINIHNFSEGNADLVETRIKRDSVLEKPFTNIISNQSFNYSKESVFRQFRTSPASHSWEALNNHMWPENLFRQARGFPKEFVG